VEGAVWAVDGGLSGGKGCGGCGVRAEGRAGGHGSEGHEDNIVGFDVNEACCAGFGCCKVDFSHGDGGAWGKGEAVDSGIWRLLEMQGDGRDCKFTIAELDTLSFKVGFNREDDRVVLVVRGTVNSSERIDTGKFLDKPV